MMPLTMAKAGERVTIRKITGRDEVRRHLAELGLVADGDVTVVHEMAGSIGIAAVVISGVILKKFKAFAGEPAPFVMELPAYHAPAMGNVLRATWEQDWSFIKRAGTVT